MWFEWSQALFLSADSGFDWGGGGRGKIGRSGGASYARLRTWRAPRAAGRRRAALETLLWTSRWRGQGSGHGPTHHWTADVPVDQYRHRRPHIGFDELTSWEGDAAGTEGS